MKQLLGFTFSFSSLHIEKNKAKEMVSLENIGSKHAYYKPAGSSIFAVTIKWSKSHVQKDPFFFFGSFLIPQNKKSDVIN